ncbi:lantibiotic dehydratase [Streptomyces parvus]|uniref:Lantibiotic dehydratase n=1 Tax=Streptomyces parvus TaxID=66428 RepID=A0A5D4JEG4_9ACTN|nr:lantibiotic dehydratase [Streptomyces parvus]TYR62715.1 lantibiotic dehydratase [Streptomyces parvus]
MTREWSIGDVFVVRHAGMPFDWLESLAAPDDLQEAAAEMLVREDVLRETTGAGFRRLERAIMQCEPGLLPSVPADWREGVDAWRAAAERYTSLYQEADQQATKNLLTILERPEVAEAILLSNPDAYHNMLRRLLDRADPLTSRRRRARRQLYTYVQRFCAKNETVSFFGPMAYATVLDATSNEPTELQTGLPRRRRVFVSYWAGRALCRALARDSRLLPDLAFHRTLQSSAPVSLPDSAGADQRHDARTVFAHLDTDGATLRNLTRATGLPAKGVARALQLLVAAGAADMRLGGGPYDLEPLTTLSAQLRLLPDSPARLERLEQLAALERCRAELEAGAGPDRERLISALEKAFTAATGEPARRAAGATYADRAVFYEEASSPFALRIGRGLAERWQEQLRGLLEVCTGHGQATQRAAADAVRRELDGVQRLDLRAYAARAAAAFPAPGSEFATSYAPVYRAEDWQAEAERLAKEAAGAHGDRYALIDLCVKAPDAAGLPEGELLVARVHHHLLVRSWLGTMYPDQEHFSAAADTWINEQDGRMVGFDFGRRNKGYYRFPTREAALRPASWTDAGQLVLRPEEFTVALDEEGIQLLDPAGAQAFAYLPLNDFVKYAPFAALSHPQVAHPSFVAGDDGGLPEIGIDGVVCQRPRWRIDSNSLDLPTPHARFLQLRRLARRTSVRFVFCRSARERKPYLVDLASPLAADLMAHVARGTDALVAEAMSPGPGELWLRDDEGRRYTSELRMQLIGREETK